VKKPYLLRLPAIVKEGELHQYSTVETQDQVLILGGVSDALNGTIFLEGSTAFFDSHRVASDTTEREHAYSE
jgi:hypothetical protein